MTAFEFVDELPNSRGRRGATDPLLVEFAAALRECPRQWARWPLPIKPGSTNTTAVRIRTGQHAAFRDGYDATTRKGELYARFIGETS